MPRQTPPATYAAIQAVRHQRHTGKQIAAEVGVSHATISRVLRSQGQSNRPARGEGLAQELVHIDDASRVGLSQILLDEKVPNAVPFLKAAAV